MSRQCCLWAPAGSWCLGLIVLMSGLLWFSIRGNLVPAQAVDIQSPLHGNYAVLNGGNSPCTNAHFRVRPQDFALDIVGVSALGNRAALFGSSREPGSYVIYGSAILSPCDGKINAVANDLPDHVPPDRDTENPAGNDEVAAGDHLGKVGNSGNTTETHLHIHAERGGEPGVILNGQAVPITIAGRYLVRNSVFRGE